MGLGIVAVHRHTCVGHEVEVAVMLSVNFEAEIRELVVLELWEDGTDIAYVEGHCHYGVSSGSVVDSRGHVNWRGGGGGGGVNL